MTIGLTGKRGLTQRLKEQSFYDANSLADMSFTGISTYPQQLGMTHSLSAAQLPYSDGHFQQPFEISPEQEEHIIESPVGSFRK